MLNSGIVYIFSPVVSSIEVLYLAIIDGVGLFTKMSFVLYTLPLSSI